MSAIQKMRKLWTELYRWFEDHTEIGSAYKITNREPCIGIHRPFQVGTVV